MGRLQKESDRRQPARGKRENSAWMIGTLLLAPVACAVLAHGAGACETVYENITVEDNAPWRRLLTTCRIAGLFADFQVVGESPYGKQIGGMIGLENGPAAAGSVNDDMPNLVFQFSPDGKLWGVWTFPVEQPLLPTGPSA